MDKAEILTKSQRENHGQDVAGIEIFKSGAHVAWVAMICLAAAVSVVDAIVFSRACYELLFAMCAGEAIVFAYKYRVLKSRHELFVMICYLVASVVFLVAWIMQILNR